MLLKPTDFPLQKKVLYCCLNWGLGHATRSVPIINELLDSGNDITLASDGLALDYLQKEFPRLPCIQISEYKIIYPYNSLFVNICLQSLKILKAILKEKKQIEVLTEKEKFDVIISDNRPGCYNKNAYNIFITHQLSPYHSIKFIAYFYAKISYLFYRKFDTIWIPDSEITKLSGSLSNYNFVKPSVHFIGALSRFQKTNEHKEKKYLTILLSGPEPQRSYLENEIYDLLKKEIAYSIVIVRGTNVENALMKPLNHIKIFDLLSTTDLQKLLNQSLLVVSRSGYTTILDLTSMQLKGILIPTPGQTEQEYLAELHSTRWPTIRQNEIKEKLMDLIQHSLVSD